jgi:membrane-associated protease RseP (regulator of RpoE activity)
VLMAGAGPAVHFVIAIALIFSVLFFAGNYRDAKVTTTLSATSAAAKDAGLQKGDVVVAINGQAVDNWEQVHPLIAGPDDNLRKTGDPIHVIVRRGDQYIDKEVPLTVITQRDGSKSIGIGISPSLAVPHPGFLESIAEAPKQTVAVAWDSLKALGGLFSPSGISNYFHILAGDKGANVNEANRPLSPVGFAQVASDAVKSGWVDAFGLLVAINVFVGLLNLMPLLPFDGGHIAVATYEKIASRISGRRVQVDVTKLLPIAVAVMAVLGFMLITSLFLDATRGVPNPF